MTLHRLTAGSGYDYLTRQVAAHDATNKGHRGLASYYTDKGDVPGQWIGAGLADIEGLNVGDTVTAAQMQLLFGAGMHPLGKERQAVALSKGATAQEMQAAARLGQPYKVFARDVTDFQREVAKRLQAHAQSLGITRAEDLPLEVKAKVRTDVGREFFRDQHGRDPVNQRELSGLIARESRPKTTAVAGFDLTFTPVKSVSTLWALAEPDVAVRIEKAHQEAVREALTFIEQNALFSRTGHGGVRQVEVTGMVAAAFTHRDSRAGDPNLHTHVAVANKVRTAGEGPDGGKWLSIDSRMIHKAAVNASEVYNTALEAALRRDLGLTFTERDNPDPRKRPVREIVGVEDSLIATWSSRRAAIDARRAQLTATFQVDHGRPPTPVEAIKLAQQATLETREAKHEPRALAEQRASWRAQAEAHLGDRDAVTSMLHAALHHPAAHRTDQHPAWEEATAAKILANVQAHRSTWQVWHVRAEALRQVRAANVPAKEVAECADALTRRVLERGSIRIISDRDDLPQPATEQVRGPAPTARSRAHTAAILGPAAANLTPSVDPVEDAFRLAIRGEGALSPDELKATAPGTQAHVALPTEQRRSTGESVYYVAGSEVFTSEAILDAEAELVALAGQRDGHTVRDADVDLALLETAANGITLNPGQAALVRSMATSGARLQLAIAPAGSGKTTAMRALASAWTGAGGTVLGLAPSAAAAAGLREQIGAHADTLAKLVDSLHPAKNPTHRPQWVNDIGPRSLIVIDEAGMADTPSLHAVATYAAARGASLRLIGDDQQLAAIGAGGVLRDIQAHHDVLHLSELMRFTDPVEGQVSLALRQGRPEALGFYLDRGRVHVGDLTTMTQAVFAAWTTDRAAGLDSIMLAPTRDLVTELNERARSHRLDAAHAAGQDLTGEVIPLADGTNASVGDLLITRANDRRLLISPTDWVKNGDRWRIEAIDPDGCLHVRHQRSQLHAHLPADYVAEHTQLGYACTIHSAQGLTADTSHTLISGQETRQSLYTAASRGRENNHLYLQVVGDGDEHTILHPATTHPQTAVDVLEGVLARDGSPRSATTTAREAADPGTRLSAEASRYLDSVLAAAEATADPATLDALEPAAEKLHPGLTEAPAWATLRAHLLLLAAQGADPLASLTAAVEARELDTALDPAAVTDWRLDASGHRDGGAHPALPWMPAVPAKLAADPEWGPYLKARDQIVRDLAHLVRERAAATTEPPVWAKPGERLTPRLLGDIEVWRRAMQIDPQDLRATGGPRQAKAQVTYRHHLQTRLRRGTDTLQAHWANTLTRHVPQLDADPYTPPLAAYLAAMSRATTPETTHAVLAAALTQGPLPDVHAADALRWRLAEHLTTEQRDAIDAELAKPVVITEHNPGEVDPGDVDPAAAPDFREFPALADEDLYDTEHDLPWESLTTTRPGADAADDVEQTGPDTAPPDEPAPYGDESSRWDDDELYDPEHELAWESLATSRPTPASDTPTEPDTEPEPASEYPALVAADETDLLVSDELPAPRIPDALETTSDAAEPTEPTKDTENTEQTTSTPAMSAAEDLFDYDTTKPWSWMMSTKDYLQFAAQTHQGEPLDPSDRENEASLARLWEQQAAEVSPQRVIELNNAARDFYASSYPGSWAQSYLTERFGTDLHNDARVQPGYAPDRWSELVTHLRRAGATDDELLAANLATLSKKGNLIDRFRDRVVLPIHDQNGDVIAFVARRNPARDDAGPKYLNTATTAAYDKSTTLYTVGALSSGTPVLTEGPMDAIAVTLACDGTHVGVASLGTALTQHQARDLASLGRPAVIATDADTAGCHAAERDYWLLSQHGLEPTRAHLTDGADPASLLQTTGPDALRRALLAAQPLSRTLIDDRLDTTLESVSALRDAVTVLAAAAPQNWAPGAEHIADRLGMSLTQVYDELARAVYRWQNDPRAGADDALSKADAKRRDQAHPANENRAAELNLEALRRMHATQAAQENQTIRPEDRRNLSLRDDPGLRR